MGTQVFDDGTMGTSGAVVAPPAVATLWGAAVLDAWFAAQLLYGAQPGINWPLWTTAAAAGLVAFAWRAGLVLRPSHPAAVSLALAVALSGAAAVTASGAMATLLAVLAVALIAVGLLSLGEPSAERIGAAFLAIAPVRASARAVHEFGVRTREASSLVRDRRSVPVIRGAALALPVVIVFALLLSNADPIFARTRDALIAALDATSFIPRTLFFLLVLVLVLGAYGVAARGGDDVPPLGPTQRLLSLGATERTMTLGAVAVLFGTFLVAQVAYLFGNVAAAAGSGVTFAEWAHRGFGEITATVTLCTLLMVLLDHGKLPGAREGTVRALQLVLVSEQMLMLGSAFRRMLLYEDAYGFTTARVNAQLYMVVVAAALAFVALEVRAGLSVARLVRRTALAATVAVGALAYWNSDAWIVERNVDRYRRTGVLDVEYLVNGLSADAVPALVRSLPALTPQLSAGTVDLLSHHYGDPRDMGGAWYEWNLRRTAAARALRTLPPR